MFPQRDNNDIIADYILCIKYLLCICHVLDTMRDSELNKTWFML